MSKQPQYDLVIEPGKTRQHYWRDLWRYRELFYFLAWRDILVRYKQTTVGLAWCIIRPLVAMLVFTLLFGKLAKFPSEGVPYSILVYAGILPWQFFANSLSEGSDSLIASAGILTKVYFPRLILPSSVLIVSLVDFLVSFLVFGVLMVFFRIMPTWRIVTLPIFLFLALLFSLGAGLWLSALNVKYRDFRYIVPFIIQFGLYISPVGFASSIIPEEWRLLYSINPMAGVIDGFRWALLGDGVNFYWPGFILSSLLGLIILRAGFFYFRKTERSFADII